MIDESDFRYIDLLGRVVALEQIIRYLLTTVVAENNLDVEKLRNTMFAGFQHGQRPIGPANDATWEKAVETLDKLFADVSERLKRDKE